MTENSTVFVVDDDPGALESLRWMLEQADFRVRAFPSSREFLDSYRPHETGCLVLDVRMPEMDGLALQKALRERKIRLPIIFMTAYGDVPTCARAFRGGAIDFLEKPVNDKVLLEHIERLIAQEEQRRGNSGSKSFGDRLKLLTPTETEVLEALIQAKSIKEIARARKVSVQTIWRHQTNIFQKIGVESHIELVRAATQWQFQHGEQAPIADR
ncbi:MAG: response regulator transcription factor [Thermoguttaceae bacterium]